MSIRRSVGTLVLWGLVLWLVVNGCIVLRPARTMAVIGAFLTSLVNSCGG